jgi:hypothetical protein
MPKKKISKQLNMKKLFLFFSAVLITINLNAQVPEKMSYQAVVRNNSNLLVTNQLVSMRISILQGSPSGKAIYIETQNSVTNINGLISIEIGEGLAIEGKFSNIEWSNDSYYIQIETDPKGGTNYSIVSTSQLLSVPYALYAKSSGSSTPGPQGPTGANGTNGKNTLVKTTNEVPGTRCATGGVKIEYGLDINNNGILDSGEIDASLTKYVCNGAAGPQGPVGNAGLIHYVGEKFGGGVIFNLWKDSLGTEHGLVVSLNDIYPWSWSNVYSTLIGPAAQSTWDGLANSNAILGQTGHTISAAKLCLDLVSGGQDDWYLPSKDELSLLWQNRFNVNKTLSSITGATPISNTPNSLSSYYWSSTENSIQQAWGFYFYDGSLNSYGKTTQLYIRAVRTF